jgi:hypothetical protein
VIVVTIDLWPHGDAAQAVRLGTIQMANDSTGSPSLASYDVRNWGRKGIPLRRYGRVEHFPRRSSTVFHLLKRALAALGY